MCEKEKTENTETEHWTQNPAIEPLLIKLAYSYRCEEDCNAIPKNEEKTKEELDPTQNTAEN